MVQDDKKLPLLRQAELFRGLDEAALGLIAEQMTEQPFANGEIVFREGDPGDRLFMLLSGAVHVYVECDGKVISYNRLQPGEFFGEMALMDAVPRSATVRAEVPSVCLTLSRQGFLDLLQQHPLIVLRMMTSLFPRLRRTNVQLQDYASRLASVDKSPDVVMNFTEYDTGGFYDEMLEADGSPRSGSALLAERVASLREGELLEHQRAAVHRTQLLRRGRRVTSRSPTG